MARLIKGFLLEDIMMYHHDHFQWDLLEIEVSFFPRQGLNYHITGFTLININNLMRYYHLTLSICIQYFSVLSNKVRNSSFLEDYNSQDHQQSSSNNRADLSDQRNQYSINTQQHQHDFKPQESLSLIIKCVLWIHISVQQQPSSSYSCYKRI